jgi:hypothetical protein
MMKIVIPFLLIVLLYSCQSNQTESKPIVQTSKQNLPVIPKSIVLFGEKISLEDEDIRERLDREIMANAYFHSQTILNMKRSARYFPVIEPILKQQSIPNDFKYLPVIESNLANVTSPAGAKGYWQHVAILKMQKIPLVLGSWQLPLIIGGLLVLNQIWHGKRQRIILIWI